MKFSLLPSPANARRPLMLACSLALASWSLTAAATDEATPQTTDLDAIFVREKSDAAPGGQVAKSAELGLLGRVDVKNTPFNITAYTAKTIEDQQAKTLADVLQNDPSVRFTNSDGHAIENFTIRGFDVQSTEISFDGMYGLASFGHVPTEFLERVEVLKGPGALLSGMAPSGGVGGVITLTPKRAGEHDLTRVGEKYVSGGYFETQADVSRRFGNERRWGLRVNAAYGDGNTGVTHETKTRKLASMALDYQGERGSLGLDAFYTREQSDDGSPVMVGFSSIGKVIDTPSGNKNLLRGVHSDFETKTAVLHGEYRLSANWSAFASVGGSRQDYDGYLYGTRIALTKANGTGSMRTYHQQGYYHNVAAQAGIRGQFKTGAITHNVTLGTSYLHQIGYYGFGSSGAFISNLYSPVTPILASNAGTLSKNTDNIFSSVAIADVMGMFDNSLQLTLGARQQRVQERVGSYDSNALTPALGVLYRPGNGPVALYANYIQGLSAGETVSDTAAPNYGQQFAPYKSKQHEVGVKWDFGQFTSTIALFQITKPSVVQNTTTLTYSASGQQRNRGMEVNVFGNLTPDIRLLGGAAFTQAKLTRTEGGENAGNYAYGVPKWTANLGGEWDLPWLSGLTLTARSVYTGTQYLDSANTLQLPDWIRFDVGARYATHVAGKPMVVRLGVDNVANRHYWSGVFNENYATIGLARTYNASVSFDF